MKTKIPLLFPCFRTRSRSLALTLSLALPLTLGLTTGSYAQTWTGGGGDNLWTTQENWSAPLVNGGVADLQFGTSAITDLQFGQSWHIHTIRFNAGAPSYTLGMTAETLALGIASDAASVYMITNESSVAQTIGANITFNHITGAGNRYFNAKTGDLIFNGGISMNKSKMILEGAGNFTFNRGISSVGNAGSVLLNSTFSGTATFASDNSFAQSISVRNGTLRVTHSGAMAGGTSDIELGIHVAGGATSTPKLMIGGATTVSRNILIQNLHQGSVAIGGDTAHTSTVAGRVALGNTAGKALTVSAVAGGTLRFTGNVEGSLTGTDNNDTLTKTGAGTVVLNGAANSYSGTTEVHEGRLLINGAYSVAGGDILVAAEAAFGGAGTVNRDVYLGDDATLVAGNGVNTSGMLKIDGDLFLGDNVTIELMLGAGLAHSGVERLSGDWGFNAQQSFLLTGDIGWGVYTGIITGLTGEEAGLLSIDQWQILNTGWEESWFVYEAGEIHLHVIPEPSTALLIGGGSLALLGLGWKRRRTAGC